MDLRTGADSRRRQGFCHRSHHAPGERKSALAFETRHQAWLPITLYAGAAVTPHAPFPRSRRPSYRAAPRSSLWTLDHSPGSSDIDEPKTAAPGEFMLSRRCRWTRVARPGVAVRATGATGVGRVREMHPLLAGFGRRTRIESTDRELPHHAFILMFQDMAVIHKRCFGGRLVEPDQQFYRLLHDDRIARPLIENVRVVAIAA